MTTIIRAYKYRAFPPAGADDDFSRALELKRALWKRLIEIESEYAARKAGLMQTERLIADRVAADKIADRAKRKAALDRLREARRELAEAVKPELLALGSWRVDRQREAKQAAAAAGLHWGDYNAVVFQFDGARAAAKARGAQVYNFETACGEALVNQIMSGRRPAQLHDFTQCKLSFLDDPNADRRKRGSHRASYKRAAIDMTLRGPRNPLGPARLSLEFVMHRPLPPNALVKEVRALRTWRTVVNRDGQCFRRPDWSVVFVLALDIAPRESRACAGLSLTWRDDGAEDGLQVYALLHDGATTKPLSMDYGYEADWQHRAELMRRAEESGDEADRAAADAFERRLLRARQIAQRTAAAAIAKRFACVAVQKIDLSGKGAKKHVAPASFRLALRHALEARGGALIEVTAPLDRNQQNSHRAQAKKLYSAACEHLSMSKISSPQQQKDESSKGLAA